MEYVDWEEYTCRFDSEEFIGLLMLLSMRVRLGWNLSMYTYKDMRDAMLEFCEIAGMPNEEGELKYLMDFDEFYGMSALSQNKEAAWCFLEHTLSEEYLTLQHGKGRPHQQMYPSNRKVLEKLLDAELGTGPEAYIGRRNEYIGAKVYEVTEFTEEDKQVLMNILENCYVGRWVELGSTFKIVTEELDYFFQGAALYLCGLKVYNGLREGGLSDGKNAEFSETTDFIACIYVFSYILRHSGG